MESLASVTYLTATNSIYSVSIYCEPSWNPQFLTCVSGRLLKIKCLDGTLNFSSSTYPDMFYSSPAVTNVLTIYLFSKAPESNLVDFSSFLPPYLQPMPQPSQHYH